MELSQAKYIADGVVSKLAPFCDRLAIAGSVRREKAEVGDIEVICIVKKVALKDIFDNKIGEQPVKGFCDVVNAWTKVKGDPTGKYTQRILPEGIKLDLFMTTVDAWGYIMVIRTGSVEFSKKVAARWVKFGYNGVDGMLNDGRRPVPIYSEMALFNLLGIPWIEPKDRL